MSTQNKLCTLLIVTLAALMTACAGGNESGDTDSSSRALTTTNSKITLAACNQATSTGGTLKVNIEALYASGVIRPDLMRLKLASMTNAYSSTSNYIQMWRWKATSAGQASLDSTPVQFRIESNSTGAALTGYMTSMRWADLSSIASSLGASTPAAFFNLVHIQADIRDQAGEYDVLKLALYDANNTAIDQVDILMPLFAVQTADYAIQGDGTARPAILANLHPFKAMTSSNLAQLTSIVNSYCF